MTLNEIVDLVRRRAGDVDPACARYTLNEIVLFIADARRLFAVKKRTGFSGLAVTTTLRSEAITPEPSEEQGVVLALLATIFLLEQQYTKRVDEGSMGISWRSGLEEESTINQEKAYRGRITEIKRELEAVLLVLDSPSAGTRPQ